MLLASELHSCLADPILGSISFLNEIISRFPNAISFAPGAPNPVQLNDIEIGRYIDRYIQYLCQDRGLTVDQARQRIYQYGPAGGLINDLIAVALWRDNGIKISPEALVITVGAQEAMLIVLRALFPSPKERLAVITPCFVGLLGAARLLDITVVDIEETAYGIDLGELDRMCKEARQATQPLRALYIAPDYSNPSGTVLNVKLRQQLLELADHHDFFILEDHTYGFTAPPGAEVPSLKALDKTGRVIFLGTFAKVCLPGARVGYVVADQLVLDKDGTSYPLACELATIKSMTTINTSPICQALIGGMLLEHGGSLATLQHQWSKFYRKNLSVLLEALKRHTSKLQSMGISWNQPTGGFFVRVRLPIPVNMKLLELSAEKYGVLWTPMSFFYPKEKDNYELRLSCSYLTAGQIEEGVNRLAHFFVAYLSSFDTSLNKTEENRGAFSE